MQLLAFLSTNAVVVALLHWFGAGWLKTRLEQSIAHEYASQLEAFKFDLSLGAEIAKKRAEIISVVWARMADYESKWYRQTVTLTGLFFEELERQNPGKVAPRVPGGIWERMDLLSEFPDFSAPQEWHDRVASEMKALHEDLSDHAATIVKEIVTSGFWLGGQLEDELKGWVRATTETMSQLGPDADDRIKFRDRMKQLRISRPDATRILTRASLDRKHNA